MQDIAKPSEAISYRPLVIVGGGIVGATTALLLAQSLAKTAPEISITLIDAGKPSPIKADVHDSRVFALSNASIRLLEHAGVWQHVQRRADYTGMQVWATNGAGELSFGKPSGREHFAQSATLGSMVEPDVINHALHEQLAKQANIITHYQTNVTQADNIVGSYLAASSTETYEPSWQLTLDDGQQLVTPLVIAADGRGSFMRQAAGIDLDTLDYKKTAICCAIKTEKSHQGVARQVFLPTGPLALLPLADLSADTADTGCWQSIVWTLPTHDALDRLAQPTEMLGKAIAASSQYVLGDVVDVQSVASFPLKAQQATQYVQTGLALIGDAAHGVHPLAGQGLNLGMLDVAVLTERLLSDFERSGGQVWAQIQILQAYEQRRRAHNSIMMHAFSVMGWVFDAQDYPAGHLIEWLRSEGMLAVSKLPLLTDWFGRQASGLGELADTRWK